MDQERELIPFALHWDDMMQTFDALTSRAQAYEMTADVIDAQEAGEHYDYGDDFFIIEDVDDAEEAREIAKHFREVHETMHKQWESWHKANKPKS